MKKTEPDINKLNSKIFDLIKTSKEIEYNDLIVKIKQIKFYTDRSLDVLKIEFKLISVHDSKLFLSEKGLKHKSFEAYLKSLNPKKEYWLSKYQVISISLVIIFGLFGVYKYFDNKELKYQHKTLKSEHETLKSDFETLTKKYDSVLKQKKELLKQNINDSLQTRNLTDLKNETDLKN